MALSSIFAILCGLKKEDVIIRRCTYKIIGFTFDHHQIRTSTDQEYNKYRPNIFDKSQAEQKAWAQ